MMYLTLPNPTVTKNVDKILLVQSMLCIHPQTKETHLSRPRPSVVSAVPSNQLVQASHLPMTQCSWILCRCLHRLLYSVGIGSTHPSFTLEVPLCGVASSLWTGRFFGFSTDFVSVQLLALLLWDHRNFSLNNSAVGTVLYI